MGDRGLVSGLGEHHLRIKGREHSLPESLGEHEHAEAIRSWLNALVGAEHLSLLVGSGLGLALAYTAGAKGLGMGKVKFSAPGADKVDDHATKSAIDAGRGEPNIE